MRVRNSVRNSCAASRSAWVRSSARYALIFTPEISLPIVASTEEGRNTVLSVGSGDAIMHQVFISATTKDLAGARMHLTKLVLQAGHHPIVEQGFQPQSNDIQLRQFLNLHLRASSAVIHLAGRCYGGEATSGASRATKRSWTQIEYVEAKRLGKKIFVGLVDPAFYRGKRYRETGGPEEQSRKAQAQRDHCARLQKGLYY